MDDRYCANCRAELPAGAMECAQCGVYAGDVFDGKMPRRSRRSWIGLVIALIAIAGAAVWLYRPAPKRQTAAQTPVRVVNRPAGARRAPGAKLSEPEAIRTLRGHLVSESLKPECLVISSQGWREGSYLLTALDRCGNTRLGRFRVDAGTGRVERR